MPGGCGETATGLETSPTERKYEDNEKVMGGWGTDGGSAKASLLR